MNSQIGMGQFAGIFLRGNPFLAMTSMVRYYVARDEESTVRVTEQLGQAKSRLTVEELLAALDDPRFNVRFEAIISIARMAPDPRLMARLEEMVNGTELALTAVAAWALGRINDPHAIPTLEESLDSDYRSIRAASARALGSLGAEEVAPKLLERLDEETDKGLQMAYASALGKFQIAAATPSLLDLLREIENEGARMELALSLARMVSDEGNFIHLLRSARSDTGTTLSQAVTTFQKRLEWPEGENASSHPCVRRTLRPWRDARRLCKLGQLIRELPKDRCSEECVMILDACAQQIADKTAFVWNM